MTVTASAVPAPTGPCAPDNADGSGAAVTAADELARGTAAALLLRTPASASLLLPSSSLNRVLGSGRSAGLQRELQQQHYGLVS
eukprot:1155124-Pelagomonas_calceolata.AAC.7